jgi:hypothetical protein
MLLASWMIALLAGVASLIGLIGQPYADETANWAAQIKGFNVGTLVASALIALSVRPATRGSRVAFQVWIGSLLVILYASICYAASLQFSGLFLIHLSVIAMGTYTLVGALINHPELRPTPRLSQTMRRVTGYTLIALGGLLILFWLSELVPAWLSGEIPNSTANTGLAANPIQVLDLGLLLPGSILIGLLTLKGHRLGTLFSPALLVAEVILGICLTAGTLWLVQAGFPDTNFILVFIPILMAVSVGVATPLLRQIHTQ